MSSELRVAWQRVLERVERIAPATRAELRRSGRDVDAAEAALGLEFGDELTTWFEIVECSTLIGTAELFPLNNVIGLDAAVAQTRLSRDIWGDTEARNYSDNLTMAGTPTWTWRPEYVFVGIDGMGGGLFVDLRRGPLHGCVRWWDKVDADAYRFDPLASGLTDLLERVATALDGGASVDGWTPVASDDGHLTWEEGPPDVQQPARRTQ